MYYKRKKNKIIILLLLTITFTRNKLFLIINSEKCDLIKACYKNAFCCHLVM